MSFFDIAEPLIEMGWHVFPLRPGTNGYFASDDDPAWTQARGGGGFYWGTTDRVKIDSWSRLWHKANIALRTGEIVRPSSSSTWISASRIEHAGGRRYARRSRLPLPGAERDRTNPFWRNALVLPPHRPVKVERVSAWVSADGWRKSNIDISRRWARHPAADARGGQGRVHLGAAAVDEDGRPKRLVPLPRWVMEMMRPAMTLQLRSERQALHATGAQQLA